MKVFIMAAVLPLALAPAAAGAASLARQTCAKGADIRVVEVVSPGDVGAACDLRYIRDGGANVSVPFNADNATAFCGQRARDLVTSLVAAGYACDAAGAFDKVAAMQETVDLDSVLAGGRETQAVGAGAPPVTATAPTDTLTQPPSAPVAVAESAPTVPAPPVVQHTAPLAPATADGAPVALTLAPTPAQPVRARYSVGTVVGAGPEDARLSTLAALGEDDQENGDRLSPATPDDVDGATGRPVRDAVRATVMAQAAAWNDGDLAGFMNGFWNSPDFTLISGTTVTKGWSETYKRYREGYGESGDLGRLVYSDVDVKMIAEDTASVVGRFAYRRGAASSAGAMTLVLRRIEGAWRVVQHQMTTDPETPAASATAATPPGPAGTLR